MTNYTKEDVYRLAYKEVQERLPLEMVEDDPSATAVLVQVWVAYSVGAVFGFEKATEERPEPASEEEIEAQVADFMKWLATAPETDEPEAS